MLHQVRLPLQRVAAVVVVVAAAAAAAAAAAGYNPCPGSKPLANHVPRGCTNPFPTLTLIKIYECFIISKTL